MIKVALDVGVKGIVVPMVNDRQAAGSAVAVFRGTLGGPAKFLRVAAGRSPWLACAEEAVQRQRVTAFGAYHEPADPGEGAVERSDDVVTPSRVLLFLTISLLAGCATVPAGPSVMALPGPGKSLEQFHADDTFCRQWAAQQDQATANSAAAQSYGSGMRQRSYDMAYLQCMYAKGNQIPGVAPGAPAPPPPGALAPPGPQPPTKAP